MIEVAQLTKRFSDKKLFENVSLKFNNNNAYGVIGANGAGKSTFLKILAGQIEASEGKVIIEKSKRISTLEQDRNKYNDIIVTDVVISGFPELYQIQEEKNAIYYNSDATPQDFERAGDLEEKFGMLGGYTAESDAQRLLSDLGITSEKWNIQMSELKAGEKVKVLLARALFGNPDILIMDEPTNHLDLKSIAWLEKFLVDFDSIVIVVSHDSDFLDNICTHIIDIDFGEARMFTGNYSFWKQSSELALELKKQQNAKKEDQIKQLEAFIARFSANASKSSQATSRRKTLEKISLEEIKPSTRRYPYIRFDLNRDLGKEILSVSNLSYTTPEGEVLFENLTFKLLPGEKMILLGQNDIAKTKLLEILMGETKPNKGEVKWGVTITPDYVPSNNDKFFNNNKNLLEWISQWTDENSDELMRSFLGRMFFGGEAVFKKAKDTSGGEKVRLMFSRAMLRSSNFLIFDQPLDHLDTESIDSVIEGLNKYQGGLIFTTYNKAFAQTVANTILELGSQGSLFFRGSIKDYLNSSDIQKKVEAIK